MVASSSKYLPALGLAGAAAALLIAPAARADGWSGAVGIASDKVFRGLSQTGGRPAALLDLAYRSDTGWFAGVGLANVRGGAGKTIAEITPSAGHGWQLGDNWSTSVSLAHYAYPGSQSRAYDDYDEVSATLGWRGRVFATVALSPDTKSRNAAEWPVTGRTLAYELSWQQPLAGRLAFEAGLGRFDLHAIGGASYTYGSAGLSWAAGPATAYLSVIVGPEIAGAPSIGGRRGVASVLWSF